MAEVICNTSPIQYLHQAGYLGLLPQIFTNVAVPPAVVQEIDTGIEFGIDLPKLGELDWLNVMAPPSVHGDRLEWELGKGEFEAIGLAMSSPDPLLVIDDLMARRIAMNEGVPITGTLGVLLSAKKKGFVPRIEPILETLVGLGFWMDAKTKTLVLVKAGESKG